MSYENAVPAIEHVHGGTPTATAGAPLPGAPQPGAPQPGAPRPGAPRSSEGSTETARLAMILVHGRGATAGNILGLADELDGESGFAYLAPQAHGHSWYPYSFLAPMEKNEPGLSSGLARLGALVSDLESRGIPAERTVLLGFSQGACLTLEFAARHARRFAGVVALTGGLIGPPGTPREYAGDFAGTPIFLGSSDRDPHVPLERVRESSAVLRRMGAEVEERIYPGMPHTIIADELDWVRQLQASLAAA